MDTVDRFIAVAIGAAICLAIGLCGGAASARADDWHDTSNYPGRAAAFKFGSYVLDQNHAVRFGNWTIAFRPNENPILEDKGGAIWTVTTNPRNGLALTCTNTVIGAVQCVMILGYRPADACVISTNDQRIPIACPTEITFEH